MATTVINESVERDRCLLVNQLMFHVDSRLPRPLILVPFCPNPLSHEHIRGLDATMILMSKLLEITLR